MTVYSMIVLALFVVMWGICTYEINSKNRLVRKLDQENEDVTKDYNQLVKDYNDIVDFLEKHFTREQLDELFLDHDMDNFIGTDGEMNEEMRAMLKQHLRESLDER